MKKLLLTLSSMMVLAACGQANNDKAEDASQSSESQTEQSSQSEATESESHEHEGEEHEHEVEISKENVVAKEGDKYIVAHGDHFHEMPVDDVDADLQKELDAYLEENPNLKAEYEKKQKIQDGYFEDSEVKERELSDWEGDWQSVYPFLQDGTLDPVMEVKALNSDGEKTAEEYKEYYEVGYKTDVKEIKIHGNEITFIKEDGTEVTGEYKSEGYKILDYEKGNRGVRSLFTKVGGDDEAFASVQFSDHNIAPTEDVHHFHIFFSNDSQDKLLEEMDNWPTYYPLDWDGDQILEDQLHH